MQGWVDLSDWLQTEMVYLPTDSHPSKYYPGPVSINYAEQSQCTNHYTTLPRTVDELFQNVQKS